MGAMVTVFDPQGNRGEIPQDSLAAFVKAGGMPSVTMKSPDGVDGYVPANRMHEALSAGAKLVPFEQQDVKHPGLWATLYDDAKQIGKSVLTAGPTSGSGDQIDRDAAYQEKLIQEGHSLPYRLAMSLTPDAMRESAESGDIGGVVGHATAAAAMAASPLATEAGTAAASRGAAAVSDIAKAGAKSAGPALKAAASRWPEAAGATAGAVAGHATGIPGAGYVGASVGREMGAALRGKLANVLAKTPKDFVSELDATADNVDYAGEKAPKPAPWDAHDATKEFPAFAGGMDEWSAKPSRPLSDLDPATVAQKAAARKPATAQPAPTPKPTPAPITPSGDAFLDRLRGIARDIEQRPVKASAESAVEASVPGPEQDLTDILRESMTPENLKKFRARKAAATVQ